MEFWNWSIWPAWISSSFLGKKQGWKKKKSSWRKESENLLDLPAAKSSCGAWIGGTFGKQLFHASSFSRVESPRGIWAVANKETLVAAGVVKMWNAPPSRLLFLCTRAPSLSLWKERRARGERAPGCILLARLAIAPRRNSPLWAVKHSARG